MKKILFTLAAILLICSLVMIFSEEKISGGILTFALSSLCFFTGRVLEENIYRPGNKITGKEKVIDLKNENGVCRRYISEHCFWVFTDGSVLLPDNIKAINAFNIDGTRIEAVIKKWRKAKKMPDRIYFFEKEKGISCKDLEKHYINVISRIPLNALAAFNAAYPTFYKKFPNGIQRKTREGKFFYAIFSEQYKGGFVDVSCINKEWSGGVWFAGILEN